MERVIDQPKSQIGFIRWRSGKLQEAVPLPNSVNLWAGPGC